jgi:hypothetical protein
VVENEDLVNFPNWLPLNFRIAQDGWFDAAIVAVLSYRQELDLAAASHDLRQPQALTLMRGVLAKKRRSRRRRPKRLRP